MDEKKQKMKEYQKKYRQLNAEKIKQYRDNIDTDSKREYNKKYRESCKRKFTEFMENNPDIIINDNSDIYTVVNDNNDDI